MYPIVKKVLFVAIIFALFPIIASAQSEVTFSIDMRTQMKDGTFLTAYHAVALTGNQLPFSKTRTIELKDITGDSIYVTKINFPSLTNGKILEYNYIIKTGNEIIKEHTPRILRLRQQREKLPVTAFNKVAW